MTISAGELLTVTRTDVGEGWWEGINSKGQSGLFPEAYVEKVVGKSSPPSMPAPVLPAQKDWGDRGGNSHNQHDDDWDDDWDNDDTYSEIGNNHPSTQTEAQTETQSIYSNEPNQNTFVEQFPYGGRSIQNDNVSITGSNVGIDGKGTVTKKSLNIFSSYVKSGLEGYILGKYLILD